MKWFVSVDAPRENDPTHCAGCGGELMPMAALRPVGAGDDPSSVVGFPSIPGDRAIRRVHRSSPARRPATRGPSRGAVTGGRLQR